MKRFKAGCSYQNFIIYFFLISIVLSSCETISQWRADEEWVEIDRNSVSRGSTAYSENGRAVYKLPVHIVQNIQIDIINNFKKNTRWFDENKIVGIRRGERIEGYLRNIEISDSILELRIYVETENGRQRIFNVPIIFTTVGRLTSNSLPDIDRNDALLKSNIYNNGDSSYEYNSSIYRSCYGSLISESLMLLGYRIQPQK